MRLEVGSQLHLQSHYVLWVVLVLFPALITLNGYPEIKSRWRCEFVSLAQWYLVAAGYVLTIMDLVVFADDRPDVLTCRITQVLQADIRPQAIVGQSNGWEFIANLLAKSMRLSIGQDRTDQRD